MNTGKPIKDKSALRWLHHRCRVATRWLLLSIALGVGSGVLLVVQAYLISRIVHLAFMAGWERSRMVPLFLILIAVIGIRAGLGWWREIVGFRAGAAVRGHVRKTIVDHLVRTGPVGIGHLPAGRLISSAFEQVEALHDFVARYLPQMALAALLPMALLAFIFPISWAAGGVLLVAAPLIPLFMILVGMGAENIAQKHFQALARMSAHFLDILQGLPTLKILGRSKDQATAVEKTSRDYRRRTMAVLKVAFLSSAVLEFFSAISIALVAVYLGMYYLGYIEFGSYARPLEFSSGFFILLLAPDFFLPLRELGAHYHARADAVGATQEILKVLDQTAAALPGANTRQKVRMPRQIRFRGVSVRYRQSDRQGLDRIDLAIGQGERIAVVGESGAGKSTLIHLLLGFITPTDGRILLDDRPLNETDITAWRRHCAWIGQHPMIFTGTLKENIGMGHSKATDGQIEAAARRAGVWEFTRRWESGLETVVGEQGLGLSVGQAQRIALARAFVKDAPLLLLDEPTASLDRSTEAEILSNLGKWSQDRTVVMATHRPAALALAQRILILKNGALIAQGDYQRLSETHREWLPRDSA